MTESKKIIRRKPKPLTPEPVKVKEVRPKIDTQGLKRIPPSGLRLQFAGELLIVKNSDERCAGFFKKFQALFEKLANTPKPDRIIEYKFLIALVLTSHARKVTDVAKKKELFDIKNSLFLNIANNPASRKKAAFLYLKSPKPRVISFCDKCTTANTTAELPRFLWKFCNSCKLDKDFFNVVSMQHRFKAGAATIFLSQDQVQRLATFNISKSANRDKFDEVLTLLRYKFGVKDLDSISLTDTITAANRLLFTS